MGKIKLESMLYNCNAIDKRITLKMYLHLNQELIEISMKDLRCRMKFLYKLNKSLPPTFSLTYRIKINA